MFCYYLPMAESVVYPPSPVPSDEHLWPGEKPFTAFGQFGEGNMDNRVFEQDTYWVDVKGNVHLIDEMTVEYQLNVIMFLIENAPHFYSMTLRRLTLGLLGDIFVAPPGYCDVDKVQAAAEAAIAHRDSRVWLESTPLMKRFREATEVEA